MKGYKPISNYGIIGNTRTAALISDEGSIDWCCFPNLASPSVFGSILDVEKGGCFKIGLNGIQGEQRYVRDTNVLRTVFKKNGTKLTITDFMPLESEVEKGIFLTPDVIYRFLECEGEQVDVDVEFSPRFNYSLNKTSIEKNTNTWIAHDSKNFLSFSGAENLQYYNYGSDYLLRGTIHMLPGSKKIFKVSWNSADSDNNAEKAKEALSKTIKIWKSWAEKSRENNKCDWTGKWLDMLIRSQLVIKLLDFPDTGAIAAAVTTSLPEDIGGVRNWDYRYCWIRDTSLSVQALVSMGHETEAIDFLQWMAKIAEEEFKQKRMIQIMFGINGSINIDEKELWYLEGYRHSRPVRIGNEAAKQFQLESFGELINTAHELLRRGFTLKSEVTEFLIKIADYICKKWIEPDHGIWEIRGVPKHFTYSKVMAWYALNTACKLFKKSAPKKVIKWEQTANTIVHVVLEKGFNRKLNSFVQYFDSEYLDASNLRIPLLEFLPINDPRVQGTIDLVLKELTNNEGFVLRYTNSDGLPGKEGAFGLCSFWLVDALALSKRIDEAKEIYSKIMSRANHLGLFPEQFNRDTGEFLGNFPQVLTHIGAINSALYIAYAEGKSIPHPLPVGTAEHRQYMEREV